MQVLLLGLFVALFLHDATTAVVVQSPDGSVRYVEALPSDAWPYLGPLPVALIVLGPKLLIVLGYHAACARTRNKLGKQGGHRTANRLDRLTGLLPMLLLVLFAVDLWVGALRNVRLVLHHTVLVDELVVLLPTLLTATLAWWSYYPVDRKLRDAAIMRMADEGRPIYPPQSRGQYVSMQMRHQFGLLLLPLLVIFAWNESLTLLGPDHRGLLSEDLQVALAPVGVLGVFILAPLVIRYVWQTAPLPDGEVRDRMLGLCKLHNVKVRQLLLWRTGGGLVNAAVTGLVRWVRYILLSDGLLDQVPPRAVEAVMAHELAHVKCKHIIWMGLALVATLGVIELAGHLAIDRLLIPALGNVSIAAVASETGVDLYDPQARILIIALPAFSLTLWIFGWVSRRIERQADVFAARHLAQTADDKQFDAYARQVFDNASIQTMVDALQRVAVLNHAPVGRKSWRHGSIAWRQSHLRSLVGRPIDDTPVDVVLGRVKTATLLGLGVLILSYLDWFQWGWG